MHEKVSFATSEKKMPVKLILLGEGRTKQTRFEMCDGRRKKRKLGELHERIIN